MKYIDGPNCTPGSETLRSHLRRALVCTLATIVILGGQGRANAENDPPEGTRVMNGVELYTLFRDKTWKWPAGAGRMHDEGRVFSAWSGSEAEAVWAEGRWIVTDTGRLCLEAVWHTKDDTFEDKTCFRNRADGQKIFQKKEPDGDWYVFRHAEPQEGDEFMNLVDEDLVSDKLKTLRKSHP